MDVLISGHNWVYSFHALIVGPFLGIVGYLGDKYSKGFTKYDDYLRACFKVLLVIGVVVALYHSHKLLLNNKSYNKIFQ
uniref:Uncharacterized protein n=1 Tax=viral metagenome TaxID=1070528 RepID=A0A6C0BS92_9ZZZZ